MPENLHKEVIELFSDILKDNKIKKHLKILRNYHEETCEHCLRVGLISMELGYRNFLSKKQLKKLGYAGIFHDIGKIEISKGILSSRKSLNKIERSSIEHHPRIGFTKLKKIGCKEIGKIIIAHHEFQENPYPRKKNIKKIKERRRKDVKIKKLAQILSLADMYDALAHERTYKKSLTKKQTVQKIQKEFKGEKSYLKIKDG